MPEGYRLDDLGWYQFERLCQALLRTKYGAALEAWGGGSDFGRDAYADGPLTYPDPKRDTAGPFVFQVKFVANANATGAKPKPALIKAVQAEIQRIEDRMAKAEWDEPAVYSLITNVPLGAAARRDVKALLAETLPNTQIVLSGAGEVSADLDDAPAVRISYPQILGLRDLKHLLTSTVHADVVNRSTLSIEATAALAKVFVATETYNRTLRVLDHRGFAVLTGPPEMGKTATAWMVALARLTAGWEVYDCRGPRDLFKVHDTERPQMFIADDAFGQSEYRPDVAADWAADLDRVVGLCDRRHWVIWTSRPGPLKIGMERLHLRGTIPDFPDPLQVVADASRLSVAEKAQILYRHVKAAGLPAEARALVRAQARSIVQSPYFTPFRIQRLVTTQLPTIIQAPAGEWPELLRVAVADGLQKPSNTMRTSFNALPGEARNLLISMLNSQQAPLPIDELRDRLTALQGSVPTVAVDKLVDLIEDHFLRVLTEL